MEEIKKWDDHKLVSEKMLGCQNKFSPLQRVGFNTELNPTQIQILE